MAATQTTVAIRSYRIYFRDARNSIAAGHEVDLPSDDEARALAALFLVERNVSYSAEVWDRTRLFCEVRKAMKTTRRRQNDRATGGYYQHNVVESRLAILALFTLRPIVP